jgi:hypothetical protein
MIAPEVKLLQPPAVKVCASLAFEVRDRNLWQGRADAR